MSPKFHPKKAIARYFRTLALEISEALEVGSLFSELARLAREDTAQYVVAKMPKAMAIPKVRDFWEYVVDRVFADGDGHSSSSPIAPLDLHLEFGVHRGVSLKFFAMRVPGKKWYGFDSFAGLKEDWPGLGMKRGTFALDEIPKGFPPNVELVPGWFQDSLPEFLSSHLGPVRFLHLDADTYESTKFVLDALRDRIQSGTWIVFDEYFNYNGWRFAGEYRAFQDWASINGVVYEYRAYSERQVAIELISKGS